MRYVQAFKIFVSLATLAPSNATLPCAHNSALLQILRLNPNVQNVAAYGDHDGRLTEKEYADLHGKTLESIQQQYAASGQLNCNGLIAEAQLTVKDNIITTASHVLEDLETCQHYANAEQCKFSYISKGRRITIPVESLVEKGFRCPGRHSPDLDWAVMKLKSPATGVTPYRLPNENESYVKKGRKVVAVAEMSIDFQKKDPVSGKITYPRHIEDCEIRDLYGAPPRLYGDNCSGSKGSSGGSILSDDMESPALLATVSYSLETADEALRAKGSGVPNIRPYEKDVWQNFSVPVDGAFLNAIRKAIK